MLDILDEFDTIGLPQSPLEGLEDEPPKTEGVLYEENTKLLKSMLEYFKEGVDCYMMLSKQNRTGRVIPDINCYIVLQLVERGRFGIGLLLESLSKLKTKMKTRAMEQGVIPKQIPHVKQPAKNVGEMIGELFRKKYRQGPQSQRTHESKVDLKKETANGLMNLQNFKPKPKLDPLRDRPQRKVVVDKLGLGLDNALLREDSNMYIERAREKLGRLDGLNVHGKLDTIDLALQDVFKSYEIRRSQARAVAGRKTRR